MNEIWWVINNNYWSTSRKTNSKWLKKQTKKKNIIMFSEQINKSSVLILIEQKLKIKILFFWIIGT